MLRISARAISACSIAFLTACSSAPSQNPASLPNVQPRRPAASRAKNWSNVYLINQPAKGAGYVAVYADGTSHVLYKITPGMTDASSITFDPTGNAYVYNGPSGTNCIIVFAAKTNKRLYTINGGTVALGPPAIDGQGNLYVPHFQQNRIFVYTSGTKKVMRKISAHISSPMSLAFDSKDNLYVLNAYKKIVEFAAGTNQPIRTIATGTTIAGMALDASDNLYALDIESKKEPSAIVVFPPKSSSPQTTITEGLSSPHGIAFDSTGDLFVLNGNDITAYAPGTTTPYLTFDRNNAGSIAIAIDAANNLYVASFRKGNFGVGSFKVYALGANKLLRKVSRDVNIPIALSIGP
ncbi:MAG TPA: hypothetical protein VGF98_14580 [Candidatus Tumulicola sp.]